MAIADAAIRAGDTSIEAVRAVLERQDPWPYLANGLQGLGLVDPRRESYLESYSLVRLAHRGIQAEPQVTIRDAEGRFVARVDGWLDEHAVALEADGTTKYLRGRGQRTEPSGRPAQRASVHDRPDGARVQLRSPRRHCGPVGHGGGSSGTPIDWQPGWRPPRATASRAAFTGRVERAPPPFRHPARFRGLNTGLSGGNGRGLHEEVDHEVADGGERAGRPGR